MGYVVGLEQIDSTQLEAVGGKGASLGELLRIDGVRVPAGFCVTTDAYRRILAGTPAIDALIDRLSLIGADDRAAIRTLSAEIRRVLEDAPLPDDLAAEIGNALADLGEQAAYAVRSSATAEDLPTASFAGQQDSYLNIVGLPAILRHVSRCWASLFTERAVSYRLQNGFDHRKVLMAVVVQQLVSPDASGVLFTADPVTSNRKVTTVEAVFGLGEALVSGLVDADRYQVRDDEIIAKTVASKEMAVRASESGGTHDEPVRPDRRESSVLTDEQVRQLVRLGRRIEAHYGRPQDIEWCLVGDDISLVQSRPITTLFPIPPTDDEANHVYISVGHQQMMTDAMKPLGLSFWQLTTPSPMPEAGGRLFVDVAAALATPAGRARVLDPLARSAPLVGDALQTILDRGDFIPSPPETAEPSGAAAAGPKVGAPAGSEAAPLETDPAIVVELVEQSEASIAALKHDIRPLSGTALLDFIVANIAELKQILFGARSIQVIMAGMEATWWLNDHLQEWLGEKNAADVLTRSVTDNVTSEMGLALLDVADVIRPYPEVVAFLQEVENEGRDGGAFLDELADVTGGPQARQAIRDYLDRFGMRCAGEIDITRPRWNEQPATLVPAILGNVRNFEPGARQRRLTQAREEAGSKESELLTALRALPDGEPKAAQTRAMIDRVQTFSGYREYPKYGMVSRNFVYKQALLREAQLLADNDVIGDRDDIFFLRYDELREVVRTGRADRELIDRRKAEFVTFQALTPPGVFTSDGEIVTGSYRREDLPPGALAGLAVSAGTVEGRARVVVDMADADLAPGDILVTAYTDPSWTPLFVGIAGLVTEVGGLMTHGAVIAREYGLPAVVGVQQATRLIADGQRIRLHGTEGYVELLS